MTLRCYFANEMDKCFTLGSYYPLEESPGGFCYTIDDEGDKHEINLESESDNQWRPVRSSARLVEEDPAVSDDYEEEEFKRIEKKLEQHKQTQEPCCDVALAYQLSQIQKFLRDCDSDVELVIHKDFLSLTDESCREYRGNVEQILRYIKASGELTKVADEMDRRN